MLFSNLHYWNESISLPEPIISQDYISMSSPSNKDIKNNLELMHLIQNYSKNPSPRILSDIYTYLTSDIRHINLNPFVIFMRQYDVSLSVLQSFNNSKSILKDLITKFIATKRNLLTLDDQTFGIISSIIFESMASSNRKNNTKQKMINIIQKTLTNSTFITKPKELSLTMYLINPKFNSQLFSKFLSKFRITYEFGQKYTMPSLVLKVNEDIFLILGKHLKQSGGKQNNSISTLLNFISKQEKNNHIHYVAFLDGIYFNSIIEGLTPKFSNQRILIERTLKNNQTNFFVNTSGFKKLVHDIKGLL